MRAMSRRRLPVIVWCVVIGVSVLLPTGGASAQEIFQVDTFVDAVDVDPGDGFCETDDGRCSLRAAIQETNALAGEDEVYLQDGIYSLTIDGTGEDVAATGDLDITDDLLIEGDLFGASVVRSLGSDRVFHIHGPVNPVVSLNVITVTGGGGVARGGGVYAEFDVDVFDTLVTGNSAGEEGGGIYVGTGEVRLEGATISANSVTGASGRGGGIGAAGNVTIENSTLTGNTAATGSALASSGLADLNNATIAGNPGTGAAGLLVTGNGAQITLANSIVSSNGSANCAAADSGIIVPVGNNLEFPGDTCGLAGAGDVHADPVLGGLSDNGGLTPTLPIDPASPAADAGDDATCTGEDQRSLERPFDADGNGTARCDLGAFEYVEENFDSELSIKYSARGDTFKGGVEAEAEEDGTEEPAFAPRQRQTVPASVCERTRTVDLFKIRDGKDKKIGRDKTDGAGRWTVPLDDPRGVYYAVVLEENLADESGVLINCAPDKSPKLRPPRQ